MHYDNALDLLAREACQGCPDSQLGRNEEGGWVGNHKARKEGGKEGGWWQPQGWIIAMKMAHRIARIAASVEPRLK